MSHEIDTIAYAGKVPWHSLGRKVSNDLTPEQMMKAAGVDWEVHEAPSYATYNEQTIPTGQKVLIREDTGAILSNPHQYGKCINVRFTPTRVVCHNTLTLSLSTVSKRAVRHLPFHSRH